VYFLPLCSQVYADALASIHPSRFYYTVPLCEVRPCQVYCGCVGLSVHLRKRPRQIKSVWLLKNRPLHGYLCVVWHTVFLLIVSHVFLCSVLAL
jgi:hypothetical protein